MTNPDLTRWNRAGLARFRYVDGNAVTYFDDLRRELLARFPGWQALEDSALDPGETPDAAKVARYQAVHGEWTIEIARALARSCHVLTEYADAYANEGFLPTATQLENLHRLLAPLGIQARPPASASAPLCLIAAGEPGRLPAGFQVQRVPAEGEPIVFETLADLDLDPALNELRLAGWNRSPESFHDTGQLPIPLPLPAALPAAVAGERVFLPGGGPLDPPAPPPARKLWFAPEKAPSVGQLAILVGEGAGQGGIPVRITVSSAGRELDFTPLAVKDWVSWKLAETRLLAQPEWLAAPRLNGAGILAFPDPHGMEPRQVAAFGLGGTWSFAEVAEADASRLRLSGDRVPAAGKALYQVARLERPSQGPWLVGKDALALARRQGDGFVLLGPGERVAYMSGHPPPSPTVGLEEITGNFSEAFAIFPGSRLAGGLGPAGGDLVFDGKIGELQSGQWVIAERLAAGTAGAAFRATRIQELRQGDGHFTLRLAEGLDRVDRLHGLFRQVVRPLGWDRNGTAFAGSSLALDLPDLPPALSRGRELILEHWQGGQRVAVREAKVELADRAAQRIAIVPPIAPAEEFSAYGLVVRANVVRAGHGERRPEKILGSGDAAALHQRFVLREKGIAFVADPAQPAGVAAAAEVRVEGRTWKQVGHLRDSGPADPHYTARLTEEGFLAFEFGDGQHGRRLPTGINNVRAGFRSGTGLAGNLPPGSLEKALRPHPRVAAIRQPLAATGGNSAESAAALRTNGPKSVLTFGRAVSLGDFAQLAAGQSSVWQAIALARPARPRSRATIEVVVVPAGGGELGGLEASLAAFLAEHALPGVALEIRGFTPRYLELAVGIQLVGAEFDREKVESAVRQALLSAFSLERRGLGQDLFASEVTAVVEAVPGVVNSRVVLGGDPPLRRLAAADREVIHLDARRSRWSVGSRELEL